jgi:hypothetical protein
MKCLVQLSLILFVVILASAKTNAESTSNLLDSDFTSNNWSTNIQSYHGSDTIAGVDGQYVESTITLSDHMNSMDIENVYQSDLTADVWFWNNETQSVTISQTITDSNGKEYSNNTVVSGTCATWNGCDYGTAPTNSIYITDVASDYDIVSKFSFTVPSQPDYHYGADLRNPSLILYFEPFKMDVESTSDIDIWVDNFTMGFEEEFDNTNFYFSDTFSEEMTVPNDYYLFEEDMYLYMSEPPEEIIDEPVEEITTDEVEEFIEEQMPEELLEEPDQAIETNEPETFTIGKTMFAESIDIDQTKISVMIQSQPIIVDPEFYAPINIYVEQISLFDDRQIYGNIIYNVANDPVNAYNNLIEGNKEQQYKLKEKLESMTWRN